MKVAVSGSFSWRTTAGALAVAGTIAAAVAIPGAKAEMVEVAPGYMVETDESVTGTVRIAHGFGLIYAPMPITRQLGVLEAKYPNAEIVWRNIFTTTQQRDAMLAGELEFGSCTPGPFLQSWDKGVEWKVLQVTSGFDAYLMVQPDGPETLEDFIGSDMKISPGTNTAQYFTTQKLLLDSNKPADALDKNWVRLPHPAAMQALTSEQLDGHFATADYALRHQENGMRRIASFKEAYGTFYAVAVCVMDRVVDEHPALSRGYAEVLKKTIDWIDDHPDLAAEALSKAVDGKVSAENFERYMTSPVFTTMTGNANLQEHARILNELGVLENLPEGAGDFYVYPEDAGAKW